jgi:hypothetical protein
MLGYVDVSWWVFLAVAGVILIVGFVRGLKNESDWLLARRLFFAWLVVFLVVRFAIDFIANSR